MTLRSHKCRGKEWVELYLHPLSLHGVLRKRFHHCTIKKSIQNQYTQSVTAANTVKSDRVTEVIRYTDWANKCVKSCKHRVLFFGGKERENITEYKSAKCEVCSSDCLITRKGVGRPGFDSELGHGFCSSLPRPDRRQSIQPTVWWTEGALFAAKRSNVPHTHTYSFSVCVKKCFSSFSHTSSLSDASLRG